MKKIVFWNMNGGSGKSTLALGLARELIARSKKVAIVDLDMDIGNTFSGVPVISDHDESYDFNLFDCPPTKRADILERVRTADIVIVPQHSACSLDLDDLLRDYCDSKNTYLVPTWYKYGNKIFTSKIFKTTDNRLSWSVSAQNTEVRKVCSELVDAILGKKNF